MPNPFEAMRYHSLIVDANSIPECLEVSARTAEGEVMGLRHKTLFVEGVQFHPESIGTPEGKHLLAQFPEAGGSVSDFTPAYEAVLARHSLVRGTRPSAPSANCSTARSRKF